MKRASTKMVLSRTTSSLLSLTLFALCFLQVNSFTFIEATTGDDLSQLNATLTSLQDCQIAVEDLQALLLNPPTTPTTTTTETTTPTTTPEITTPTTTPEITTPTTTTTTKTPTTITTTTNPTTTTTTPTTTSVDPSGPPPPYKRKDVNIIANSEMDFDLFLSNDDITSEGWFGEAKALSDRWETQVNTALENMNAIVYNISIDPLTNSTALDGEILKLNILVALGNDIPGLAWNSNREALLNASSETLVLVNESITVVQDAIDVAGTTTEPPTTTTTTELPATITATELPATITATELPATITATELPATNPTTEQSGTNNATDPPATNTTTEQSTENSTTDLPCDNCGNGNNGSPTLVIWLVSVLLLCVVVALVLVFWKPWKRHGTKKDLTERHGSVGVFNSGYAEEPKPSTSTMTIPRPVVIPMSDRSQRSGPSLNRYQPSISEPSPLPRSYKSYT